ncbi:hypothetical protein L226DRAFT_513177 [Lentinus tigrinus ALCF2SS1-7]|uniref:Uncharacterized protein n=1 Tax=Lentinus tigrinus ALCF2SS1-6 TaxID=1328759 RepID=A0A5C2RZD0_9APHY|nr:hypothetical protein L227DRAFT_531924 [Lentinus tigrinus ALCF2SS1-6]RPD71472.1 hypothetical protein L226DRAFT_513177 [Lentinus tigrinus ALCF2SS1-7]
MLDYPDDQSFAVIRMDPVAMVRHLDDPEALKAAEALSPQSYLVYLDGHNRLPIWGPKPWYSFDIHLIGPCLRPAHNEQCVTADMCTPIYPNQDHPAGRAPVHTEPPFPFDNCHFWSRTKMKVRVCPRTEGFDWDVTTHLSSKGEQMWRHNEICDEVKQTAAERALQPQPDPVPESCASDLAPTHPGRSLQADGSAETPLVDDDASSLYSDSVSANSCSVMSDIASADGSGYEDTMMEWRRLFADPVASPEFHPLCHLWGDIASNIKQDEIANPIHFLEERDAVVRIIREARARNPAILPMAAPEDADSKATLTLKWLGREKPKPKRFRPLKFIRKVRLHVRTLFRIPYIPVWP